MSKLSESLVTVLAHAVTFIFNRKTYALLNVVVLWAFINYWGVGAYLLIGLLVAPALAYMDYEREKTKFEHDLGTKFLWYHYIPFFLFDIVTWVYAVMGLTGDANFGYIQSDIDSCKE